MSTPVRYDEQYCPIARGLDVLGDRWTLLIVRELGTGPKRFTDLQRELPGIAATVLSDRLRTMGEDGLVEVVPSDPPGRRKRYALGPRGRQALPVLASLVRFGMPLLEPPDDQTIVRPTLAVRGAVLAYYDAVAGAGLDERYELRVDGEVFMIDSSGKPVEGDDGRGPDVMITAPARAWFDLRQHRTTIDELIAEGAVTWAGTNDALQHFRAVYGLGVQGSKIDGAVPRSRPMGSSPIR